jgi:hypothetical protein
VQVKSSEEPGERLATSSLVDAADEPDALLAR